MELTPINSSLRAIRRILRAAEQGERKLAHLTGLTPSQVLVLQEVEQAGDVIPSEIASSLQLSQASITNIVDRLEELGLVTRRKGERDKRQVRLTVTDAGRAMLEDAPDLLQNRLANCYETLPLWEQAMFLSVLERLASLLDVSKIDGMTVVSDLPSVRVLA